MNDVCLRQMMAASPDDECLTAHWQTSHHCNGANIHEANYAQEKKDFISKLEIALKEVSETKKWLSTLGSSIQLFAEVLERELSLT